MTCMMRYLWSMALILRFLYVVLVLPVCLVHAVPEAAPLSWSTTVVTCPGRQQLVVVEELFYASPRPEVCNARCRMRSNFTSADLCYFHQGRCVQRAPEELVRDVYKTCLPSPSQPEACDVTGVDRPSLTVGYTCIAHDVWQPFSGRFSWKADVMTLAVHPPWPHPARLAVCHVLAHASPVTLTTLVFPDPDADPSGDGGPPVTSSSPSDVSRSRRRAQASASSTGPRRETAMTSASSPDVSQSWSRAQTSTSGTSSSREPAVTSSSRDVRAAERAVFVLAEERRRRVEPSRFPRWQMVWEKEFVLEFYTEGDGESSPPLWITLEGSSQQQVEVRCNPGEVTTTTIAAIPRPASATSLVPAVIGAPGHTSFTLIELLVAVVAAVLGVAGLALGAFLVYRHCSRRNLQVDNTYDVLVPSVTYRNDGTDNAYVNTPNGVTTRDLSSNQSRPEPPRPRPQCRPREEGPPSQSCANHTYGQSRACAQQQLAVELPVSDDYYLKPCRLALRPFAGDDDERLGGDGKEKGCAEKNSDGDGVSNGAGGGGGDAYDEIPACKGGASS